MGHFFVELFQNIPNELAVVLICMLPIGELRLGLPIALTVYEMSVLPAMFFAFVGNIIPSLAIYFLIGPISKWLSRVSPTMDRFFTWLFERTRKKFAKQKYAEYKFIAVLLFIGIPLPLTGGWTGALAAWLFAVKPKPAVLAIAFGLLLASIIVLALTLGIAGTINVIR